MNIRRPDQCGVDLTKEQPHFDVDGKHNKRLQEALCLADDPEGGALRRGHQVHELVAANNQLASCIMLLLDAMDFTHGACSPAESVGAVVDSRILKMARNAVKAWSTIR